MGDTVGGPPGAVPPLPDGEVLARLLPYLRHSIMVVRRDWSVTADIGPPGGMLGHGPATGRHAFSFLHPDDVERVSGLAQVAMESEPGWRGSLTVRIQRADGSYGRFAILLHNRMDDPVLMGVVVVSQELPVAAPAAVDPGGVGVETLGDHLPIGVVLLDSTGAVMFTNQTACDLLDCDMDSLLDGQLPDSVSEIDRSEVAAIVARLCAGAGRESFTAAVRGDEQRLLAATFVSRVGPGSDGAVEFVIVTIEDVTHRLAHERRLEHRANHDSLTGLPNRAWLLDHLHERLARLDPVQVAFIDLDGFKGVNDRLGHAAGDDVLAEVAGGLARALIGEESVARVGGDEFVIVSPAPGAGSAADDLVARVRGAVAEVAARLGEPIGVSIGTTSSRPGDQPWDMLGRADAAMYGDKRRPDRA